LCSFLKNDDFLSFCLFFLACITPSGSQVKYEMLKQVQHDKEKTKREILLSLRSIRVTKDEMLKQVQHDYLETLKQVQGDGLRC
ncbi:MAG: hypothetical protein J7L03_00430, partial [Caldisericaceae bacterium]|nr:hypothetical protein [Caldisericaceae bacterium]